jgi:predicted transposase YdaD
MKKRMDDWDGKVKNLANAAPQDFVEWLIKGAHYVNDLSPRFATRNIEGDILFRIRIKGKLYLLHIEFQSSSDTNMARRLWEYNVAASIKYKLPVYSVVIYLKPDGKSAESPYQILLHEGKVAHSFSFEVIELWKIGTEDLFQIGLKGLLPFVSLTREGLQREAVERVIDELGQEEVDKQRELLSFTYGFASLVFKNESDRYWLKRRFEMLKDILKESWAIQELVQEVAQESVQEARAEERKQAIQRARQTLLSFIQARFRALMQLAEEQCSSIETPEQMEDLLQKIILAQDEQEVRQHLLDVKKEKV